MANIVQQMPQHPAAPATKGFVEVQAEEVAIQRWIAYNLERKEWLPSGS